ncbi:DNA gyrase subunit A [bacterium]|nr:DNA gyrase subunit A [bacterium]MBU1066026.1 DNA gyrase subunit A [bacterium]MBU1635828.1 DNA gyrase subunit A [bacterium]MBU1872558.1 DNA gyrase subunit A [bacterium]
MSKQKQVNIEFQRNKIISVNIDEEMRDAYLDYSMSVIVSRALPDVRDGLKPVHRRILYGMSGLSLPYNRPTKKCARIVGEVMGKYHPHGDAAVYDSLVRMAQLFSMRYPLVDGQGNFGSIDGDNAAAMRYTEARMSRISGELLKDIDKETVRFVPNFDDSLTEPSVLPAAVPLLLVNGSSGIAVGMATNIPPHNLTEITNAIIFLADNPDATVQDLMQFVTGPDFPTAAIILGKQGIKSAYETGKGIIKIRAQAFVETSKIGKDSVIITELPYQVNKARLIEKIADLVRDKVVEGISDIRDESDKDGIRVVVEIKRDAIPEVVLNQLYSHTQLQDSFGINMLALVDGIPKQLSLKEILGHYIDFRHEIIVKRTQFELNAAEEKAHILEGLKIALDNIDEVIVIIKASSSPADAKINLMERFELSDRQTQAILDMRLQKLTGLEVDKVVAEYKETLKLIARLKEILESKLLRMEILKNEISEVREKYGDERRTQIIEDDGEFSIEDMIAEEDMVITITHNGFIKRFPVDISRRQNRGGRGSTGAQTKDEDFVRNLFIASTHHYMMFFTNRGKIYWLKVHEIPRGSKASRGRAIVNLIETEPGEQVRAVLSVKEFDENHFVVMVTKQGTIKKTTLSAFGNPRRTGIRAINVGDDDDLIDVLLTDGDQDVILGTSHGKSIRFKESDVRSMGRTAAGVKGINLPGKDNFVVGMVIVKREGGTLLAVSENGYGKRTDIIDYPIIKRGGVGVITLKTTARNGLMVALREVVDTDDLMIITEKGVLIRLPVAMIRTISRNTQGVRLIKLDDGDSISAVTRILESNDEKEENGNDQTSLLDEEMDE